MPNERNTSNSEKTLQSLKRVLLANSWIEKSEHGRRLLIQIRNPAHEQKIRELLFDLSIFPPAIDGHLAVDNETRLKALESLGLLNGVIERSAPTPVDEPQEVIANLEQLTPVQEIAHRLEQYLHQHDHTSGYALRYRQKDCLEAIREHLAKNETSGFVRLPTGVGKTVIFSKLLAAAQVPSLVVTDSRILIHQIHTLIKKAAPPVGPAGKYYSGEKNLSRDVTITTYQSFAALVRTGKVKPDAYKLIILDEVHRCLTEVRKSALAHLVEAVKIGFSATPDYSEEKSAHRLLGHELYSMTVREAIEEGLLCPVKVGIIKTHADMRKVKLRASKDEFDEQSLETQINNKDRNNTIVRAFLHLPVQTHTLVFCNTIAHATALAETFKGSGVSSAVLTGQTSEQTRTSILDKFRRGEIQVICNAKLLTTGFDEPTVQVCINAVPTKSKLLAEQRARMTRLDPHNPSKIGIIIDCRDNNDKDNPSIKYSDILEGAEAGLKNVTPTIEFTDQPDGSLIISTTGMEAVLSNDIVVDTGAYVGETQTEQWLPLTEVLRIMRDLTGLDLREKTILRYVQRYRRASKSPWFRQDQNKRLECSPHFLQAIKNEIETLKDKIPPGWVTVLELAKSLYPDSPNSDATLQQIKTALNYSRKANNSAEFAFYETLPDVTVEHFSPRIAESVRTFLKMNTIRDIHNIEDMNATFETEYRKLRNDPGVDQFLRAIITIKRPLDLLMVLTYKKMIGSNAALETELIRKFHAIAPAMTIQQLNSARDSSPVLLREEIVRHLNSRYGLP